MCEGSEGIPNRRNVEGHSTEATQKAEAHVHADTIPLAIKPGLTLLLAVLNSSLPWWRIWYSDSGWEMMLWIHYFILLDFTLL